ncbi:MAG TPA: fused MFS/spermidine synthase [Candidatus Binatia bacterium]|nr:fused MFS/spermidine synthase [Candidatus Binatia bacterium]
MYEVVWMRLLSLTFSVTVYAVTIVLCAFMTGLALGAALAGRIADRVRRPLAAYGAVELALGLTALGTIAALDRIAPAYVWLHEQLGGAGATFTVARFALAATVLLLPCTLMGATLPLLARAAIAEQAAVARGTGALYAANTFGAVAGCLLAGFVLVPALGLHATNAAAAALGLAVGVAALLLGRREAPVAARPTTRPARPGRGVALLCAAFALSGFTALGYEVLWTRALVPFTHNSTYAYTAMLAVFLFGLAAGSAVAARVAGRVGDPVLSLGLVEAAIGASVAAALPLYAHFDRLVPAAAAALGGLGSWARVVAVIFAEAAATLLVTTVLFGATFPLVARAVVDRFEALGARVGAAYTANTLGAIAGAVVVGFGLLPALGMRGSFLALAGTNLALGAGLALATRRPAGRAVAAAAGAAAVVMAAGLPADVFRATFVRRFGRVLFYREEVTDTVMVTQDARGERMIRYGDGRGTAGTFSVREDRMYAEIPLLLHPHPERVLSICFGVGNSLSSILQHPVTRVDAVELSPGVVAAAPFFASTNRDPLADPRVHLTITDGRNFLLTSADRWDVIRLDPPELHTAGVVNLYTREFYALARDHLRPGGIFSIWVNVVMTPEDDLRLLVRTVAEVFPHVTIWHGPFRYSWVVNGSLDPAPPDLALLIRKFADPRIAADLASIGVGDPFAFLVHFVRGGDEVREFAGPGPVVTDDRTRLDFTVPRSLDSFFGFANATTNGWLTDLMMPDSRVDVGLAVFLRKIGRMATFERPVFPHLVHVDATGLDPETVRARLAAAAHGPQSGPSAGTGTRPRHES